MLARLVYSVPSDRVWVVEGEYSEDGDLSSKDKQEGDDQIGPEAQLLRL